MFGLLRYFSIASAIALIAVTFVLVYLYRDNEMEHLVVSAEGQNVTLARSFANVLWPRFSDYVMTVTDTDGDTLRARPETADIDEAVRNLTTGLPVLKVKIYNLDGRTIYSSQASQIGADKSNNPGFLKSARAGKPASKFSFRENFSAFSGTVMNRDLVESYLPIWGNDDAIEGVFELYTDVTSLSAEINQHTERLTVGLLITFSVLYGMLILIVGRGNNIVKRQYTEIKQAEEALRASEARLAGMLSIAPEAIISVDKTQRIQLFNKGAENVFGYSAEEALGQSLDFLLPSSFREAHRKYVEEFARGPEVNRLMAERMELVGLRKDGTEFPAAASISKLELNNETIFTVTLQDITEQKAAKTEILQSKEQADLANRAKSEFLANMSHELRTPLNAILGFSELMVNATHGPLGNPKYEEYTKDINDSGRHLLALIQDILDLSRIEAGKLELDEEDIDVATTIGSCLVLVKERARTGGVTLKTDLPDGLPTLNADQRKLKQILVNLLSNAVKFTPAGGEVTLKAWSRPDSGYVFQVIDTGIGIALADIPTALSPFGQVDSQLDRKYEGTGLGLPLTKSLVEMHGGSLDLQSEQGAGTTVTVRFPSERIVYVSEIEAIGAPGA